MKSTRPKRAGWIYAGLAGLMGACQAQAQVSLPTQRPKPFSPDFLNTLGVGSRSIAMGSAFTALADDVTATFWNPARLSTIQTRQFMLEARSVIESNSKTSNINGPAVPNTGFHAGSPQLSFVGLVIPLENFRRGRNQPQDTIETTGRGYYGHIGISYTLGGYFSGNTTQDLQSTIPGETPTTTTNHIMLQQRVRSQYYNISYGNRTGGTIRYGRHSDPKKTRYTLGYGAGIVFLNEDQNLQTLDQVTGSTNVTTITNLTNKGSGTGYIVGLSYGIGSAGSPLYRLGIAYRSAIKIHYDKPAEADTGNIGGTGEAFGDEIPSRLSIGLAYEGKLARDPLRVAVEEQIFSSANRRLISFGAGPLQQQQDLRSAVANFHIGVELEPNRSPLKYIFGKGNAIRFGFHTNEAAATQYTFYTNVFSLGYALQSRDSRGNLIASLEPTAEIITRNGGALWTLSGLYRF